MSYNAFAARPFPPGGTAGQVPTKQSSLEGDVAWADPSSSVASVNGQTGVVVLTAADTGAGLEFFPGHISGRTYQPAGVTYGSNGVLAVGTLFAIPIYVGASCAFNAILWASLGVAGSFLRTGIYADGGGRPGALIVDAGQTACTFAGETGVAISQTLAGLVWLAAVGQGNAPSVTRLAVSISPYIGAVAGAMYSGGDSGYAYSQTGVAGALPSPWGATYTLVNAGNVAPRLGLRAA
jgi:hypothetical protein